MEIKFEIYDTHLKTMQKDAQQYHEFVRYLGDERYAIRQFIGLKSESGDDVYTGDVVKYGRYFHGKISVELTGEIIYNDFASAFQIKYKNIFNGYAADFVHNFKVLRVIGNIYENPELLSAKTEA